MCGIKKPTKKQKPKCENAKLKLELHVVSLLLLANDWIAIQVHHNIQSCKYKCKANTKYKHTNFMMTEYHGP